MAEPLLRPIEARDDAAVAAIIREVMPAFGACGAGFPISDREVDAMSAAYAAPRSAYFVVEEGGRVIGGAGIAPLDGGDADTCELRKMYYLPAARGRGLGERVLRLCLEQAREFGFRRNQHGGGAGHLRPGMGQLGVRTLDTGCGQTDAGGRAQLFSRKFQALFNGRDRRAQMARHSIEPSAASCRVGSSFSHQYRQRARIRLTQESAVWRTSATGRSSATRLSLRRPALDPYA